MYHPTLFLLNDFCFQLSMNISQRKDEDYCVWIANLQVPVTWIHIYILPLVKKVYTLKMTVCPDLKFWSILLIVFANTVLILKVYVCRVGVV